MAKTASTLKAPHLSKSTLTSRRNTGVSLGESTPSDFHEHRRYFCCGSQREELKLSKSSPLERCVPQGLGDGFVHELFRHS